MIDQRLAELGLTLPEVPVPVASYVNAVRSGNLLHLSGGLPIDGDTKYLGKVPSQCPVEEAVEAARLALLGRLSVIKSELGSLDRVTRIVALNGYVNATADFTEHPRVINGASDLLLEIFGDKGKHSRTAIGVSSLPLGVAVELNLVVKVAD